MLAVCVALVACLRRSERRYSELTAAHRGLWDWNLELQAAAAADTDTRIEWYRILVSRLSARTRLHEDWLTGLERRVRERELGMERVTFSQS